MFNGEVCKTRERYKVKVDLDKGKVDLLPFKRVDLRFSTKSEITQSNAKEIDLAVLHKESSSIVKKLHHEEARKSFTCKIPDHQVYVLMDPKVAVKPEGEETFDKLLEEFVKLNWLSGTKADKISRQIKEIVKANSFKNSANEFRRTKTRVDQFWIKEIKTAEPERHCELKEFLEKSLILSHGNAHVERGFSINKECLVENLKERSLIGIRMVYDGVTADGGFQNLKITKSLIHAVRNSSSMYKEHLKESRLQKSDLKKTQDEMRRKRKLLQELKCKKAKVMEDANTESEAIEKQIADLSKQL